MNFRNSDCVRPVWTMSRVSTVQCVANTLFLTLEQVYGRIKSLIVYSSTSVFDSKVFAHTRSCFTIATRNNHRGSLRLRASCLPKYISIASVLAKL